MKGPEYYDKRFIEPRYNTHYSYVVYLPVWEKVISLISPEDYILELGCGTGQFAELCVDSGRKYGIGIDFSPVAIQKCNERLGISPLSDSTFWCTDVLFGPLIDTWTVVILETLEHIDDDIKLLKKYKDCRILFSVPDFDCESHVRHFPTLADVRERYGWLNITQIIPFSIKTHTIWLVEVNE